MRGTGFGAGRPQNGAQAHDLSRELEVRQSGSGRRYPVLGPPSTETYAWGDSISSRFADRKRRENQQ